jgi:hypothetical protein
LTRARSSIFWQLLNISSRRSNKRLEMLLPFFLLGMFALGFLVYRLLSAMKCRRPKFLAAIALCAALLFCFLDQLIGSALGFIWVKQGEKGVDVSIPVKVDSAVWSFSDVEAKENETSHGQLPVADSLYGIDLYFEEMVGRGYGQLEVVHPYDAGRTYVLLVTANADAPGCQFFLKLPMNHGDTASPIPERAGRYTRDDLRQAGKTLVNGSGAACISVIGTTELTGKILEKYESSPFGILGIRLQHRATRKLIDTNSNLILAERREVWSDGGWFMKYVLATPETGTSGRGYRYGDATAPLTVPATRQAVSN